MKLLTALFFRWKYAWLSWILAACVAFAFTSTVIASRLESTCLAKGFPDARVTWNFHRYCVRRVNQTDEVIALP